MQSVHSDRSHHSQQSFHSQRAPPSHQSGALSLKNQPVSSDKPGSRIQFDQDLSASPHSLQHHIASDPRSNESYQQANERYTTAARIGGQTGPSDAPQRESRNPIFERKQYRGSQGASYSPLKDRDEDLLRQVLYSKVKPSQPTATNNDLLNIRSLSPINQKGNADDQSATSFQAKSRPPAEKAKKSFLSAAKDDVLNVLGESRNMDKEIDAKLDSRYSNSSAAYKQQGSRLELRSSNAATPLSKGPSEPQRQTPQGLQSHHWDHEQSFHSTASKGAGATSKNNADSVRNTPGSRPNASGVWDKEQSFSYLNAPSPIDQKRTVTTEGQLHTGTWGHEHTGDTPVSRKQEAWPGSQNSQHLKSNNSLNLQKGASRDQEIAESARFNDKTYEPPVPSLKDTGSFNTPALMEMILKENQHLKGEVARGSADDAKNAVPNEFYGSTNDVKQKLAQRNTDTRLKQYNQLSNGPDKHQREDVIEVSNQSSYQKEQRKSNININVSAQSQSSARTPELKLRNQNDVNDISVASSHRGRDMTRTGGPDDSSELIDAWPSKKFREIPRSNYDSSDEEDDDEGNFCGICISKRKKDKRKR